MQQRPDEDVGFIAGLLKPLFDRIGLNGAQGVQRSQQPPKPSAVVLSDSQLKAMGYSDADIKAVRKMEKQRGR